nr:unnamed protein product [Spirometra erinaceieuropaei]
MPVNGALPTRKLRGGWPPHSPFLAPFQEGATCWQGVDQRKILNNLYSKEDQLDLKCKEIELQWSCKKAVAQMRPLSSLNFHHLSDGYVGTVVTQSALMKHVPGLPRPLTAREKYQHKVLYPLAQTGRDSAKLIDLAVRICLPDFIISKRPTHLEEPQAKTLSSWCLHPLVGFFFPDDNSISLYEEHHSVRSRRTLPFLKRQPAVCFWGRKTGLRYTCVDLTPGALLFLGGLDLTHLPDVLRVCLSQTGGILCLRVVRVDARSRQIHLRNALEMAGVEENMLFATLARMHISRLDVRPTQQIGLTRIQRRLRLTIRETPDPVVTYLGLVKYFQALSHQLYEQLDSDSPIGHCLLASLDREELEYGLAQAGFYLDQDESDLLFSIWENTSGRNGEPTASEFLQLAFGVVPEHRRYYIAKAFMKMDPSCLGQVKTFEILRFYSLSPTIRQEIGPEIAHERSRLFDILQDLGLTPGRVDFTEFLAYYTAVSHAIGGDPIVDSVPKSGESGTEDDAHLLMNLAFTPHSCSTSKPLQNAQTDTFVKLMRRAWRI